MASRLQSKGLYNALSSNFEDARQRNLSMIDRIHRDTIEAIKRYLTRAGFRVTKEPEPAYVDAVVIVEAVKE